MLHDFDSKRRYHITFYGGYRKVLAMTTIIARAYTVHGILAEMALKQLPESVKEEYTKISVMPGEIIREEFAS